MNWWLVAFPRGKQVGEVSFRQRRPGLVALVTAAAPGCFAPELSVSALGQVPQTLNGPPVQVQPYVSEPGVPIIKIAPGTLNTFPIGDGSGTGDGAGTGGDDSGDDGIGAGTTNNSEALTTMLGTTWGATAVANAQALGLNPSALAATCVIESSCQNLSGSGAQGVFQMYPAAFQEGIQTALSIDPSLSSQIVSGDAGRMDPVTESIAAAGYQLQAVEALQNAGIANPTVLDTRGFCNFGPANGVALATADPSETMAAAMPNVSAATLVKNGVTPGETVGQWQASIRAKIGSAANQTVLRV
jgi:hypothetical protein